MKILLEKHNTFNFNLPYKVERFARIGILVIAFLVIAYCIWTLDRGLEITDEAYYLLLAMHADSVKFYISAQQWITSGFWQITGSITRFRAAGMVLLLASSTLLSLGIFSACKRFDLVADRFEFKSLVISGSAVGAMLYASTINLSPCYNLLASVGAYAAAGMVLLASNRSNFTSKYVLYALAGCAVGVEVVCKPSAGVSTLALLIVWVASFEHSRLDKVFGLMTMVFGALTFAIILLLVNTTISDAKQAVEHGVQLFRMVQVETVGERLIRYFIEYCKSILITLRAFAVPILAMIVYVNRRRIFFAILSLVALLIIIKQKRYYLGGWNADYFLVPPISIYAMLFLALIVSIPIWNKNRSTLTLFAGLIALPYSVAIGTGNALFTQVVDSFAPWAALIAVLMVAHQRDDFNKLITSLVGLCFIMIIALRIFTSSLSSYHMFLPLEKQDQVVIVGNLGKIKVDTSTFKFITDLKTAAEACDIAPGAPFIGLYNIPGVALVLQATPLMTPWLNNREQAKFVLDRMRLEALHSTIVALRMGRNDISPPMPQQLATFPLGYRYCGMATYPYEQQKIQIWQSRV